ncbi:MAG: hypothetical protein K8S54_10885 [Spirochaetia bacterium]|nr:hypothetical protein [Spirochaetia bacterium]
MIYFSDSAESLSEKLVTGRVQGPVICEKPSDEFDLGSVLGRQIGKTNGPIILTGHQPVFHHPGIVVKNLLAHELARRTGGTAIHMVHDTDEEEIVFQFPERAGDSVRKQSVRLNGNGGILQNESFPNAGRKQMREAVQNLYAGSRRVLAPEMAAQVHRSLDWLEEIIDSATRPMDIPDQLRLKWEEANGINVTTIYSSQLFESPAFRCFFDYIRAHGPRFRGVYNRLLQEYRLAKGIKNPAQPLPDLHQNELPFWVVIDGNRTPFREGETSVDGSAKILPRAVTLTLFCRLFFCDIFIHGLGGERYDRITDEILREFFDFAGAPFTAASATLSLKPKADLRIDGREPRTIARDLRALEFDPTRFLEKSNPIRTEKENKIRERNQKPEMRAALHREFLRLNSIARESLRNLEDDLGREQEKSRIAEINRSLYGARDLPFFFYDLTELFTAVRNYGLLFEKRSPSASLAAARS